MIRILFATVVICFLSLTSLPASSLTPQPIGWDKLIATANVIVLILPGPDGKARYWLLKANIEGTIHCIKYDTAKSSEQPVTGQDTWLSAIIFTAMFPVKTPENTSGPPMSDTENAWCKQ